MQESEHRFLSASDEFHTKTCFVNEMWQTDFTYFKIIGWGWYYLSTVIDDYSRYIVHWELCKSMNAEDVKRTVDRAMKAVGLTKKSRQSYSRTTAPAIYRIIWKGILKKRMA
jgi:putative transposase